MEFPSLHTPLQKYKHMLEMENYKNAKITKYICVVFFFVCVLGNTCDYSNSSMLYMVFAKHCFYSLSALKNNHIILNGVQFIGKDS